MGSRRIKIFVDAHCLDKEYQGSATFVRELYRELTKKKDIDFYIAAHNQNILEKHFPATDNITHLKYKTTSGTFRLAFEIPKLIKRYKIDYAHFQYITPLIKNCKQIVTIHDVIFNDYPQEFSRPYRVLKNFLYKRSADTADILTTVSNYSKRSAEKHLHTDSEKINVIHNGVNDIFFNEPDKEDAKE
jgi:glycosyltransferase involved in cell wall biosynthesis